jgi:hypothetical protein
MFKRKNPVAELRGSSRVQRLQKIAAKGCSSEFLQEVLSCLLEMIHDAEFSTRVIEALLTLIKLNAAEVDFKAIVEALSSVALSVEQEVAMCHALLTTGSDESAILDYTAEVALRHVGERALVDFITDVVQK